LDGAKIKIKAGVTETVDMLFLDGEQQASGTWGATGSGAANVNDTFFTGGGVLSVTTGSAIPYADALWDGGGTDTNLSTAAKLGRRRPPSFEVTRAQSSHPAAPWRPSTHPLVSPKCIFAQTPTSRWRPARASSRTARAASKAGVPNTTSRTYTLAEDIVLGDHQFWSITNNGAGTTTLNVTGAISDGNQRSP
jgi:hypothetical protein